MNAEQQYGTDKESSTQLTKDQEVQTIQGYTIWTAALHFALQPMETSRAVTLEKHAPAQCTTAPAVPHFSGLPEPHRLDSCCQPSGAQCEPHLTLPVHKGLVGMPVNGKGTGAACPLILAVQPLNLQAVKSHMSGESSCEDSSYPSQQLSRSLAICLKLSLPLSS